jgi:CspA family cold shock protein
MRSATTKWFNNGYGFLVDSETKEDIFVHYSNLIMDGYKSLHEDDMVEYELGAGKDGRQQAINVKPILTRKMIKDSLKEDNLHIQTVKDGYGVTKYQVVDGNNVLQTDENGISFMELAAYANFEIVEKSA